MILGNEIAYFQAEVSSAATACGGVQPNTLEVQKDGTLNLIRNRTPSAARTITAR